MRRLLAIILLALLPLQFSWAAVASYCGHEVQASAAHAGHEHQHHADSRSDAELLVGAAADAVADVDGNADEAPASMEQDCGHCHCHCSVMPTLVAAVPGTLSTALPNAALDEAGGAHPAARPERPQWRHLA